MDGDRFGLSRLPARRARPARWLLAILVVGGLAAGCSASRATSGGMSSGTPSLPPSSSVSARESSAGSNGQAHLIVFAAASLGDVLKTATAAYESAHPGSSLVVSTGSSAALATQIEQGAPVDLFLSADMKNPQSLVDRGLAKGPVAPFARNTLVVVVPTGNPAGIRSPLDLARPGVRVVAAGDAVPISGYARSVVTALGSQPGYPPDFAARYEANVVSKEDDVRSVLAKVALGEADAAIVYATDAASSSAVRSVPIPAPADVIATYGGVVPTASSDAQGARAFLDWLAGPDGRSIMAGAGFLPPT